MQNYYNLVVNSLADTKYLHIDQKVRATVKFGFPLFINAYRNNIEEIIANKKLAFSVEEYVNDIITSNHELRNRSQYDGWGFSSWFAAYPDKIIGTLKITSSLMFPVTVEGTKEDVINYFAVHLGNKAEPQKEDIKLRIRIAKARAKALFLLSEQNEGLSGESCDIERNDFTTQALIFISKAIKHNQFFRELNCTPFLTERTRKIIFQYNGWQISKLLFPAKYIRHIHNKHSDYFKDADDFKQIIEGINNPSYIDKYLSSSSSIVLSKSISGGSLKIVLSLRADPYQTTDDNKIFLKTSYKKEGLGHQDACVSNPHEDVRNAPPRPFFTAKIVDIQIQ